MLKINKKTIALLVIVSVVGAGFIIALGIGSYLQGFQFLFNCRYPGCVPPPTSTPTCCQPPTTLTVPTPQALRTPAPGEFPWYLPPSVPEPYEGIAVGLDYSALPPEIRACVSFSYIILDGTIVRSGKIPDGELVEIMLPVKPGGVHELWNARATHGYDLGTGDSKWVDIAWADPTYIQILAGRGNLIKFTETLPSEELKNICSK